MMHADLIDQDDLLSKLRSLGFEVSSGASAEQACECAVRGLSEARAKALKGMVEQMYSGSCDDSAGGAAGDRQAVIAGADAVQTELRRLTDRYRGKPPPTF